MRSGYVAAKRIARRALSRLAQKTARCDPAASMTAPRSSIRASSVAASRIRSESPVPRLSSIRTRPASARPMTWRLSSGCSHIESSSPENPRAKTMSVGPSPTIWYAIATSPLRAYWTSGISTGESSH